MHAQQEKLNFWKPLILWHSYKSMRDETVMWLEKKTQDTFSDWKGAMRFEMNAPDLTARTLILLTEMGKLGNWCRKNLPSLTGWVKLKSRWISWAFLSWKMSDWEQTQRHLWAFKGENVFWGQGIVHGTQDSLFPLGFVRWHYPATLNVQVQGWGSQSCGVGNFQHPEVEEQMPGSSSCLFP